MSPRAAAGAAPALDVAGAGATTVLLLHGIGGGRRIWGRPEEGGSGTLAALAASGWRVAALDFPGYGDSAALGPPTLGTLAAAVRAALEALGTPRAVLVGHSMGGMVAQEVAAQAPAIVQGLVLACTSARFGAGDGQWQAQFVRDRLAPLDAGLGMAGMAARLVPTLVGPSAGEGARAAAAAIMAAVPEATYRSALSAIAGFDRRASLADIHVPTLVLAAEHDRTAPPELMQRMASRIRGSEYRCLPGAGHIANLEAPGAFDAEVLGFLHRHFTTPRAGQPACQEPVPCTSPATPRT